jgi:hypothetical protein
MKNIIFLMGVLISIQSCLDKPLDPKYALSVINNSEDSVCAYSADRRRPTQYPDTLLLANRPALFIIRPGGKSYNDSQIPWTKEVEQLPGDTLSVFIIDAKLYRDSSWSYIRDNYRILKRYDLSSDNLKLLNSEIPYPPTEWMKENVKMYP